MYRFLRPLLFRLGADRAHGLTLRAARAIEATAPELLDTLYGWEEAALYQSLWGLDFTNPVGLAAGFDKDARLLACWKHLGMGFAEVGSVTARRSSGNSLPRAFRLPDDRALINRMGLPGEGAKAVAARLRERPPRWPLGVNIAKTPDPDLVGGAAVDDFRRSFHELAPEADYVVLNVSCPNTRDGRTFEEPEALDALLEAIFAERARLHLKGPVLVKLSPPYTEHLAFDNRLETAVDVALEHDVDGFVASNTAPDRKGLSASEERLQAIGAGGLSGAPLEARATALVRYLYRKTDGQVPIIGVGGVRSAETAYAKIRAGASLVQLYTGLVYEGPALVRRIKKGLTHLLDRDGCASLAEAVGAGAERDLRVKAAA